MKNEVKVEAGRLGGLATLERHSREQRVKWCRLGGRPRLKTLEEMKQQLAPVVEIKLKEDGNSFMGLLNTRGRGYSVIAGSLSRKETR